MSIAAIAWVFSQRIKPSWLKFLLVALADNANDLGEAWPSITAICQKTSLNRKTVIDGLDELEKRNLIEDTSRRTGQTSSIKVYRLLGRLAKQSRARNGSADGAVPSIREAVPSIPREPSEPSKPLSPEKRKARGVEEVKSYAQQIGVSDSDAEAFFDSQEAGGWTRNGRPLRDWRAALRSWKANGWLPSQKQSGRDFRSNSKLPDPRATRIDAQYEAAQRRQQERKNYEIPQRAG
jgi:hypothetical protein